MQIQIVKPSHPLLIPLVDHYYDVDAAVASEGKVLPEGKYDLVFGFGALGKFRRDGRIIPMPPIMLTGMNDGLMEVLPNHSLRAFGVKFKASGLQPFLRFGLDQISNRVVSADDVFLSSELKELHEQLWLSEGVHTKVQRIETFLLKKLKTFADLRITEALRRITNCHGAVTIDALADGAEISVRRFGELFARAVGVSPKAYCRIVRFHTIVRHLQSGCFHDSLTEVAYDHGYTDQSHFIKDFRSIAKISPGAFLKANRPSDFYNFSQV